MKKALIQFTMIIPLVFLLCFTFSCQKQAEEAKPGVDIEAEKQAIRELIQEWFEAENRKDLEATVRACADDIIAQLPNMPQAEGREAMRNFYTEFFKMLVSIEGGSTKVVVSAAGDMAYDFGWGQMVLEGPEGRIEDKTKYLAVWKKINGEWKCVAISSSSDKPAK